ncbi:MFS transporter [Streptomyces sp. NPDC054841]
MSTTALPVTLPAVPDRSPRTWPRSIWGLLAVSFLVRGCGYVYPFLAYHVSDLGFSTAEVARVLAAFGVGWLLGQPACGWLADRFGRRATLVGAMATATLTLPFLAHAASAPTVLACAAIAGAVYDAPRPIVTALLSDLIPTDEGRAAVDGLRNFVINAAAAGTGFAGGLLAGRTGVAPLIWLNAVACALCAVIAWRFLDDARPARDTSAARPSHRVALGDVRLWLLTLASLAALIPAAGMFQSLPLLMSADGLDEAAYGWTQLANGLAVLLCTPILTPWLSRKAALGPMLAPLASSAVALSTGMTVAGYASTTLGYSVTAALLVPGEIVLFVAAGNVLVYLAPTDARATYAGVWGATLAAAVILAPLLTGWALGQGGGRFAAVVTGATGLLGAALILPLAALMHRPLVQPGPQRLPQPAT